MSLTVYVVRRPRPNGYEVVSAWVDEYFAKFEAQRWSQDFKEEWDYVPATLVLEEGNPDAATTESAQPIEG